MKRIALYSIFILALIVCMIREARACEPQITDIRYGELEGVGYWAYWFCTDTGTLKYEWRGIHRSNVTQQIKDSIEAYVMGKNPSLTSQITLSGDDPSLAAIKPFVAGLQANDPNKPVIASWHVSKNGTSLTRPLFPVVNGKRSYSSDGTISIGSPCDPSITLVEGSLSFLQVSPGHVAVCSKP